MRAGSTHGGSRSSGRRLLVVAVGFVMIAVIALVLWLDDGSDRFDPSRAKDDAARETGASSEGPRRSPRLPEVERREPAELAPTSSHADEDEPVHLVGVLVQDRLSGMRVTPETVRPFDEGVERVPPRRRSFGLDRAPAWFERAAVASAVDRELEIVLSDDVGGLSFRRTFDDADEVQHWPNGIEVRVFRLPVYACIDVRMSHLVKHYGGEISAIAVPPYAHLPAVLLESELDGVQRAHLAALERTVPLLYLGQLRYIVDGASTRGIVTPEELSEVRGWLGATHSRKLFATAWAQDLTEEDRPDGTLYVPHDGEMLVSARIVTSEPSGPELRRVTVQRGETTIVHVEPRAIPYVEGTVLAPDGPPVVGAHVGVLVERRFDGSVPAPVWPSREEYAEFLVQDDGSAVLVYLTAVTSTDENGAFRVPVAFTGTTQVYVIDDGYHTEFAPVVESANLTDPVERLEIHLRRIEPSERIRMRVVNRDGEPQPNDWFYPRLAANPLCRYPKLTPDENGMVDVTHLEEGATYNIRAEDDWAQVGVTRHAFVCEDGGDIRIDWDLD